MKLILKCDLQELVSLPYSYIIVCYLLYHSQAHGGCFVILVDPEICELWMLYWDASYRGFS